MLNNYWHNKNNGPKQALVYVYSTQQKANTS